MTPQKIAHHFWPGSSMANGWNISCSGWHYIWVVLYEGVGLFPFFMSHIYLILFNWLIWEFTIQYFNLCQETCLHFATFFCKEAVSSSSEASPRTSFPLKVFQWDVSLHKWTKNELFWCCILSRLGSQLGTCLYSTIVPTHFTLYIGVTSTKFSGF